MKIKDTNLVKDLSSDEMTNCSGGISFTPIVVQRKPSGMVEATMTVDWGGEAGKIEYKRGRSKYEGTGYWNKRSVPV